MEALYERYRRAVGDEPLPLGLVDLDALDRNVDTLVAPVRGAGKTLRIATKSLRSTDLIRYVAKRGGAAVRGLLAYTPAEAIWLADEGFDDILVAYPSARRGDVDPVAIAIARGKRIALTVDDPAQLAVADAAGRAAGVRIPLVVDVDVSYRTFGGRAHVGVRRSPLHEPAEVADFAASVRASKNAQLAGLLAYEAHVAGIDDRGARAALKRVARPAVAKQRRAVVDELTRRGLLPPLVNGGGTGSVRSSSDDSTLTEVTVGSGFLDSHLFDGYADLALEPAACYALQITRRPAAGYVTCQGGGFVASGAPGADRLPVPYLPQGLSLTRLEGAGEVQTPLVVPRGVILPLGAPVFFRHAKAGELAEHFASYLLVRGERVEGHATTYRGAGRAF